MTIETDLFTYLDSNITDTHFALTMAGPDARAPFVEITMSDHRRTRTTGGISPMKITEFDIECWNNNSVNAATLCANVSALLQDFSGLLNGNTEVERTRIFNEFSGSDAGAELYNRSFSVQFTHR
jgi:hypothetical protein